MNTQHKMFAIRRCYLDKDYKFTYFCLCVVTKPTTKGINIWVVWEIVKWKKLINIYIVKIDKI